MPAGSVADIVACTAEKTNVDEINALFREEAAGVRYQKVLGVSTIPLVSTDILMDPRASVVDLTMTRVIEGDLVKIMSWYDNEWGYSNQMIRTARAMLDVQQ